MAAACGAALAALAHVASATEIPAVPSTGLSAERSIDQSAEEKFQNADADGDGAIDRREWDVVTVSAFLTEWDKDGDAQVSRDDLRALMKTNPGATRTEEEVAADLFGHLDLNGDLLIDTAEVLKTHAYLFDSYGGADDGRITLAEYQDYLKQAKFDVLR